MQGHTESTQTSSVLRGFNLGFVASVSELALLTTLAVIAAAYFATGLLWVENGEMGLSKIGPWWFALAGVVPALLTGLLCSPLKRLKSVARSDFFLAICGGLLLAIALAVFSVVSGQAVIDLRGELSRGVYLGALFAVDTVLVIAPASGLVATSWGFGVCAETT